ncbi:MAG: polysaccharide biosynthesis/export family protein [Planctomycetales bacterium]|nr:polysaccharide biosynthesis/export family protein [Planctomycetales bacterium]
MNSRKMSMVTKQDSPTNVRRSRSWQRFTLVCVVASTFLSGCTALTQPINGIPSNRLPSQFFVGEKNNLIPIDVSILAQEPPRDYVLGPGDVLGITVDKIFPYYEPGEIPEPPPVHFPEQEDTLPPSTGFPITVLEDGTISLPLLDPIEVEGLTTDQTRDKIREAYVNAKILREDAQTKVSPIVTLIKKRQIQVVVIRQDQGNSSTDYYLQQVNRSGRGVTGADESATGQVVKLNAFENDILHALMETGGLPGVGAKNELKILRSTAKDKAARRAFVEQYAQIVAYHTDPCSCPPPMPEDPTILRIPLRLPPGTLPSVTPEDVILEEGDIILIETRDNEFFYTGGLLPGGQWPIPRDYDLDVLGAMAISGAGVSTLNVRSGSSSLVGGSQVIPPGRLYVLRNTPCNGQIAIEVDIAKAINDPRQRVIVQPGDTLILQYKPCEEAINFGIGAFFVYGIRNLFN